jgi:hypothetical protein
VDAKASIGKYPKCPGYEAKVNKIQFNAGKTDLYAPIIAEIFISLKAHYQPNIEASEKKYVAQLEAAIGNNSHENVGETQNHQIDKGPLKRYQESIDLIRSRASKSIIKIDKRENKMKQTVCYEIEEIRNKRRHPKEMITNLKAYVANICQEANNEFLIEVAVNDNEMAEYVQDTGLKVSNYFDPIIVINTPDPSKKLDDQLSQPELADVWNKLDHSFTRNGISEDITEEEYKKLIYYGSAWVVCTAEAIAAKELLLGVETVYPVILLKWKLKKDEPNKAAALKEIWDSLMTLIGRAREIFNFEICLVRRNQYFQYTLRPSFYDDFDTEYGIVLRQKKQLGINILNAMHIFNYILSME